MRRILFLLFNRTYLTHIPFSTVMLNFLFQRVFRQFARFKYMIHYTSRVQGVSNIILADCDKLKTSFAVSGGCYFAAGDEKIIFEEGVIFAPNVCIVSMNHVPGKLDSFVSKPVYIGKNCWIGTGATILAGVHLGNNVVVGANSVVTKSFGDNVIIAGNPAKIVKEILCVE